MTPKVLRPIALIGTVAAMLTVTIVLTLTFYGFHERRW
jgi:hypothetical protein